MLLLVLAPQAPDARQDAYLDAVRKGDVAAVKAVLDQGVEVDAKFRYDRTALSFAADRGSVEIVKMLLERGADVNAKDTFYNATALIWALDKGHVEIVRLLLDKGATGGEDALQTGVDKDNAALVALAIDKVKPTPDELSVALASAEKDGKTAIAEQLRKAGAKPLAPGRLQGAGRGAGQVRRHLPGDQRPGGEARGEGRRPDLPHLRTEAAAAGGGRRRDLPARGRGRAHRGRPVRGHEGRRPECQGRPAGDPAAPRGGDEVNRCPLLVLLAVASAAAGPRRRSPGRPSAGPRASGVAEGPAALKWNGETGEGVLWKAEIPGLSVSSPIVWGDRVFVATAVSSDPNATFRHGLYGDVEPSKDVSKHSWRVIALDRKTGQGRVGARRPRGDPQDQAPPQVEPGHADPGHRRQDARRVLRLGGALRLRPRRASRCGSKDLGILNAGWFYDPDYEWGYSSSPVIYKDLVFLQCDIQKGSFVAAYRLKDGSQAWRTERDEIPSFGTPTIYEGPTGAELVTHATKFIRGYDPLTGKELWRLGPNSEVTTPTPIVAHDLIFVTNGYRGIQPIYAIKPGSRGDLTLPKDKDSSEAIAWSKTRGGPYTPTPIVYGDYLYTCTNQGVLTCYKAKTGEQVYQKRIGDVGGAYSASPVAADGKLYFSEEDGPIRVVKAGPEYELLSTNPMGEVLMATPAISDGVIYVRGLKHLFAIGTREKTGDGLLAASVRSSIPAG